VTYLASKAIEFGDKRKIMAIRGLRRSRSFKFIAVGINRKTVCYFLLVILTSYLIPFRSYRSLLFKFWTLCVSEPLFGGGGLGTTYAVHLGLIEKCVVDFLLVIIKLFFAMCHGWGATSENISKIGDCAPTRSDSPEISRRGLPHQLFLQYS